LGRRKSYEENHDESRKKDTQYRPQILRDWLTE
jgi:hypothetical protein